MKTYRIARNWHIAGTALSFLLLATGCQRSTAPAPPTTQPSAIKVSVNNAGPVIITSRDAEFQVLPSGYITAALLKGREKLTLEDSAGSKAANSIQVGNKPVSFALQTGAAKTSQATGKIGRGQRVEIPAQASDPALNSLQASLVIEVYDDLPNIAFTTMQYKNAGTGDLHLAEVTTQAHEFSSHSPNTAAYDMWSFQGASREWGEDEMLKLKPGFSRENQMGAVVKGGYGGGIPIVAFWTASVGEALGHAETLPLTVSLPVKVEKQSGVAASMVIPGDVLLKAGDSWSTPRSFVSVYSGDFYEPLRLWSTVLGKEGWQLPKPSGEAYNASWCGWGYEFNVTPAQMVGTIPKLKEMGIKWATLDDRWFDTYGDWNPRSDTFPGDSIKKMVADFHKQGELVQLWWLPLGVEDGQGRWESHKYIVSQVVKD